MALTPRPSFASSWVSTGAWPPESIFDAELVDQHDGFARLRVSGRGAWRVFQHEPGGHRWQRVPPNDKRGRVHTSTVTVAILREPVGVSIELRDDDLEWTSARGSGAGGQARNRRATALRLVHRPSGITIRLDGGRNLAQKKKTALEILRARLFQAAEAERLGRRNQARQGQIGTGMRGDKVRTIRLQDGVVVDHRLRRKIRARAYLRGDWRELLGR